MQNTVALSEYLLPIQSLLDDQEVSEILINRPQLVYIERKGLFQREINNQITYSHLRGLTNLIARYSNQRLNETEPLLSAHLHTGHRVQIVLPPATLIERVILSFRNQTIEDITLDDYLKWGTFEHTVVSRYRPFHARILTDEDQHLSALLKGKNYIQFLKKAIELKKNILISGGTSTGKTTLLNACLKEIPDYEHIVTIEDVPELFPPDVMHTPLFTSKGLQGQAKVTMQDLIQATLRLRPDRIILGELRGAEASDFINATATGHDGSISSVHAASTSVAFMRLVHMVKLSGTSLSRDDILNDLQTIVDVVVQIKRKVVNQRLVREVSEIYFAGFNE